MAQKLHSQYGFSYDNLKVLLGGWNTWKQEHAKDPAKYPEGGTDATPGAGPPTAAPNPANDVAPPAGVTVVIGTPAPQP